MKTPEEIKKGLEHCSQNDPYPCNGCPYERDELLENAWRCNLNADTLAYIKRLEAQIPKWISVEEALPEHGRHLVITQKGVCMTRKVHTATYNHLGWWTYADYGEVTHWMPLPELPKEG